MKTCAIISEYNPFHSGHKYHLEKTRELTGADCTIAVMSGNFTQRGEPAIFDKWTRATCAVMSGVNLVIELPFCFAAQTAEIFAEGAVGIINFLNCVDYISFGSECGDINELTAAVSEFSDEKIKLELKTGSSYPSAVSKSHNSELFTPNNILGLEYIRAAQKLKSDISLITIRREGNGYNTDTADGKFISAASCRNLIKSNNFTVLKKYIQPDVLDIFNKCINIGKYSEYNLLSSLALGIARSGRITENTPYVSEGIENRFYKMAFLAENLDRLIELIKTKRYTHNRIRRIICNAMVGLTTEKLNSFRHAGAGYLNVLAADEIGYKLLNTIKKSSDINIISKISDSKTLSGIQREMFETDYISSAIYALSMKNSSFRTNATEIRRLY